MRVIFLILLSVSLLAVPCGIVALFGSPVHAIAFLVPSFGFLGCALIAYVLDDNGRLKAGGGRAGNDRKRR